MKLSFTLEMPRTRSARCGFRFVVKKKRRHLLSTRVQPAENCIRFGNDTTSREETAGKLGECLVCTVRLISPQAQDKKLSFIKQRTEAYFHECF